MRIDSHQHYWFYHPVKDAWITDEMNVIKRNFSPDDVWPLMQKNNIEGCIAVQADQSENETQYLLSLAEQHPFIKAVVGWVDFRSPDIAERLEYFSRFKLLKGFRHIVQAEKEDFVPYFEAVLNIFSADRILFGTDWPVCLTGQSYNQVCELTQSLIGMLSTSDPEKIWGGNAKACYGL